MRLSIIIEGVPLLPGIRSRARRPGGTSPTTVEPRSSATGKRIVALKRYSAAITNTVPPPRRTHHHRFTRIKPPLDYINIAEMDGPDRPNG
jgi:hypothetical protein